MNKIALVGLGYLGKIHLRILSEGTGWELTGVYDIDAKLCRELALQYQVKAFSSLEELLENCDAVDIVTPSNTHFEIAEKYFDDKIAFYINQYRRNLLVSLYLPKLYILFFCSFPCKIGYWVCVM